MTLEDRPPSDLNWRRIDVVSGHTNHGGWWRELGDQVHLESEYGNAIAPVRGRAAEELAVEMLLDLAQRRSPS